MKTPKNKSSYPANYCLKPKVNVLKTGLEVELPRLPDQGSIGSTS